MDIAGNFSNIISNVTFSGVQKTNNTQSGRSFSNLQPLDKDTLELSPKQAVKTTIKDKSGNTVEAEIKKETDGRTHFICVNGKKLGYAHITEYDDNKRLLLSDLHTEEHANRNYKGAGTELLKSVVQESINLGYKGKLDVCASHGTKSPVIFYYKNNFRTFNEENNAFIQYAIHNGKEINNYMHHDQQMFLDEEGAKALLEGKRLYEDNTFEKIGEEIIDDENCSANLIHSPKDNKYYLIIANEDFDEGCFFAALEERENENGKKHFMVCKMDRCNGNKAHRSFAFKILDDLAEEKGFGKTTISKDGLSKDIKTQGIYNKLPVKLEEE